MVVAGFAHLAPAASAAVQAASDDGRWMVSGDQAQVIVAEHGRQLKKLAARSMGGNEDAAVVSAQHLPLRKSFLVAFDRRLLELWELSVDRDAEPIFNGLVHDYRMGEGIRTPGFLAPRRVVLSAALRELAVDASQVFVLARLADDSPSGRARLVLLNLDVRRAIAQWEIDADPDFTTPARLQRAGRPVIELRDRLGGPSIVVDLRDRTLGYGD